MVLCVRDVMIQIVSYSTSNIGCSDICYLRLQLNRVNTTVFIQERLPINRSAHQTSCSYVFWVKMRSDPVTEVNSALLSDNNMGQIVDYPATGVHAFG